MPEELSRADTEILSAWAKDQGLALAGSERNSPEYKEWLKYTGEAYTWASRRAKELAKQYRLKTLSSGVMALLEGAANLLADSRWTRQQAANNSSVSQFRDAAQIEGRFEAAHKAACELVKKEADSVRESTEGDSWLTSGVEVPEFLPVPVREPRKRRIGYRAKHRKHCRQEPVKGAVPKKLTNVPPPPKSHERCIGCGSYTKWVPLPNAPEDGNQYLLCSFCGYDRGYVDAKGQIVQPKQKMGRPFKRRVLVSEEPAAPDPPDCVSLAPFRDSEDRVEPVQSAQGVQEDWI